MRSLEVQLDRNYAETIAAFGQLDFVNLGFSQTESYVDYSLSEIVSPFPLDY